MITVTWHMHHAILFYRQLLFTLPANKTLPAAFIRGSAGSGKGMPMSWCHNYSALKHTATWILQTSPSKLYPFAWKFNITCWWNMLICSRIGSMVHSYEIFLGFMLLNIIIFLGGVIEYGFKLTWMVTWLLKRNKYGYRLVILSFRWLRHI